MPDSTPVLLVTAIWSVRHFLRLSRTERHPLDLPTGRRTVDDVLRLREQGERHDWSRWSRKLIEWAVVATVVVKSLVALHDAGVLP